MWGLGVRRERYLPMREDGRWKQELSRGLNEEIDLHLEQLRFWLLSRLPTCLHDLANATGMFAVESLGQRFCKRGALGIPDHHARPADGLQQHPVQPESQAEGQDQQKLGITNEHPS